MLFSLSTFLGLYTIASHFCVMCSDPGILSTKQPKASPEYREVCLDLDSTEKVVFDDDTIYQHSLYYQFRNCDTCMLTRTPKASHCAACGHCVQGWDHHCVLLNNCVGARNYRAFVTFLLMSFLFALSVFWSSICILFMKRDYTERSPAKIITCGCGIILVLLFFSLTYKPGYRRA